MRMHVHIPSRMPSQHEPLVRTAQLVRSAQHVLAHLAGQLLDALCLLPRSGLSAQQARRSFRADAARGAAKTMEESHAVAGTPQRQ